MQLVQLVRLVRVRSFQNVLYIGCTGTVYLYVGLRSFGSFGGLASLGGPPVRAELRRARVTRRPACSSMPLSHTGAQNLCSSMLLCHLTLKVAFKEAVQRNYSKKLCSVTLYSVSLNSVSLFLCMYMHRFTLVYLYNVGDAVLGIFGTLASFGGAHCRQTPLKSARQASQTQIF